MLVIDISMPIPDGSRAVAQLNSHRRMRVVFLNASPGPRISLRPHFAVGASANVVKSDSNTELVPAICEALKGRRYVADGGSDVFERHPSSAMA